MNSVLRCKYSILRATSESIQNSQQINITAGVQCWHYHMLDIQSSRLWLDFTSCLRCALRAIASHLPMALMTSKILCSNLVTEWKTPRTLHTRAKKDMRSSGRYFKSRISVRHLLLALINHADRGNTGSRYIYDLYYDKEAMSKQLYDWLLKNNYADANLIAKWKKQGYEKVGLHRRQIKHCHLPTVY